MRSDAHLSGWAPAPAIFGLASAGPLAAFVGFGWAPAGFGGTYGDEPPRVSFTTKW